MADPRWQCLVFARDICVVWDASFPFWEIIVTVLVTAAVTYITVRVSVRAARLETDRVLAADAEQRTREDEVQRLALEEEREEDSRQSRAALAREMTRLSAASHQLQLASELKREEVILAKAEWSALRVAFETSGQPLADELYEWANSSLADAHRKPLGGDAEPSAMTHFARQYIDGEIGRRASAWALEPESIREQTTRQLEEQRARRARRIDRILQEVGQLPMDPPM